MVHFKSIKFDISYAYKGYLKWPLFMVGYTQLLFTVKIHHVIRIFGLQQSATQFCFAKGRG